MEASECSRRRIGQIARHLRGTFGILNQTCSGARKDGRVFFARQASESHGQFMRPFQTKQESNGESNEGGGTKQLPAFGSGTIDEKWSSSGVKDNKVNADSASAPIFAKVAPVSETSTAKIEPVDSQLTAFQGLGRKSLSTGSLKELPSNLDNTTTRGPASPNDSGSGVEVARKSPSPPSTSEHPNPERLGFEWFPRMDVVESGTAYVITVELPGVSADGIQIEVVRGSLVVTGSRVTDWWKSNGNGVNGGGTVYHRRELAQGPYRTVWRLPKNGDINGITAEFIDGFLRILVPKIKVMTYL
ncbi:hypothetical protein Mapa_010243 [Marchantia paleacea]|nr:hypothetical protein Mapa_010243 [Marchantia paleacea]